MSKSEGLLVEHLLRRAGFGASPSELTYYKSLGYDHTLKELLNPENVDDSELDNAIAAQNFDFTRLDDLKRWWIFRMAYTRRPLQEKITLFWHGHFATSNRKVNNPYAMYMQNVMFRRLGMSNFHDLLLASSRDPAMIVWLDNQQNRKGNPNENYAREIMELFSLGIGNYSEQDIKESARAFTGWQTKNGAFSFNDKQHDDGSKTILGETGKFGGEDVVQILSDQPAASKFIATKLCKFFVADEPSDQIISDVAAAYDKRGDNLRAMLKVLFKHHDFKGQIAYHAKIKSPVELLIGSLKTLQIKQLDGDLPSLLARMGQNLFEPASVKGWDGGAAWIATDTMMERFNFATRVTQQKFDAAEAYVKPSELVAKNGLTQPDQIVDYFLDLLVSGDVPISTKSQLLDYLNSGTTAKVPLMQNDKLLDSKLRGLVHLIMTLPTYQLA